MVIFVCILIEYSDWEDRMLSKIGDTKLDNDRFLSGMQHSMTVNHVYEDDSVSILDNSLFDVDDEHKP